MTDRTIAVTGAAGFIGSRIVTLLNEAHPGWEIAAIDNFYEGTIREIGDVTVEHVDIRHRDHLEAAIDGADVVMHLAAISGVDDCDQNKDQAYDVNVTGTNNVAWYCRKSGAGLIFPYSMAVLGDPDAFPITVDQSRGPMNWYGRTKLLGERAIEDFSDDAFPAHCFMKSNLYGEHDVDGQRVSKGTVINFFVDRAISGETLTVYAPGTQARNYVHVDDVARAYVLSAERLLNQLDAGVTGVEKYEIASSEHPGVMDVAQLVQRIAGKELGRDVDVSLVDNPRSGETLVEAFSVDTSRAESQLGWVPERRVEETVRRLILNSS